MPGAPAKPNTPASPPSPRRYRLAPACWNWAAAAAMTASGFSIAASTSSPPTARRNWPSRRAGVSAGRSRCCSSRTSTRSRPSTVVWANACLLHVPRTALPGILARIHRALKPGGLFYASFKAGTAEGRDRFGRYFNYPSPDGLRSAYGPAGWQSLVIGEETGGGYDGEPTSWLHVTAVKDTAVNRP